ncbi:MAG: PAS domain-containing protein [Anaerolineae bacterium]|nr:PAS domain-containing protein [Anaerolineae bacterium]
MLMLPDYRVRQRDYLLEITRALTQELDLEQLLDLILSFSMDILAGTAGLILLRDENAGWQIRVSRGLSKPANDFISNSLNKIELSDQPINELSEIGHFFKDVISQVSFGALNGVGLPLVTRKVLLGGIYIFRSNHQMFTENDRSLLSSFANQAAVAIQNAQLYSSVVFSNQRSDALLNSAADGMFILRSNHLIESCNNAFARMIDESKEAIINHDHSQIIRWAKRQSEIDLEKAEAGGWPLTPHAQLYVEGDLERRPPSPPLPVGITYAPLIDTNGKLQNIIANVRDITRFRQAEEIKSTFISIISHELKTPVALIKGYVSTLRREDARWDNKTVADSLAVIEEEADRLTELIENLLDATRLQSGGVKLSRSDCNLKDLCRTISERFGNQNTNHKIVLDFPDYFPVILADETRIRQVITNLLSNAFKYAPQGEVIISGRVRPEIVIICISDEGPGISSEDSPYIFDRFYRSTEVQNKIKGAGLGLFLSKTIIEAHRGQIWVDAGIEKGARVCFSLPKE